MGNDTTRIAAGTRPDSRVSPSDRAVRTSEHVPDATPRRAPGANRKPTPTGLSKTTVNFWLDALLLVLFTALLFASAVVRFVFPFGPDALAWTLWGGSYFEWIAVQFIILCLFALAVLVHVMLHWTWVCGVLARWRRSAQGGKAIWNDGTRTLIGVATLIVILHLIAFGLLAAKLMIAAS